MLNQHECVRQITKIILGKRRSTRHRHPLLRLLAGPSDTTMIMSFEQCMGSADDQGGVFRAVGRFPNMTRASRGGGNG